MNQLMESMQTSSGLKLSLKWKSKKALKEEQLDTRKLVDILQKDYDIMRPEEITQLSQHFRSKIDEARKTAGESDGVQSFHSIMKEVLDYRKWFEFQLEYQKTGEKKKNLRIVHSLHLVVEKRQWQCMFHYSLQLRQNMKGQEVMHQE